MDMSYNGHFDTDCIFSLQVSQWEHPGWTAAAGGDRGLADQYYVHTGGDSGEKKDKGEKGEKGEKKDKDKKKKDKDNHNDAIVAGVAGLAVGGLAGAAMASSSPGKLTFQMLTWWLTNDGYRCCLRRAASATARA